MSTALTWQTESTNLEDTLKLAGKVGHNLRGGEVIELVSDLGGGKTAFVKGLAQGMGSQDVVRSPSFTISNQYQAGGMRLHHFDFYRLEEPGIISDELAELLNDDKTVVVIEWANIVEGILPAARLTIKIQTISENVRRFTFVYPDSLTYLIPINS